MITARKIQVVKKRNFMFYSGDVILFNIIFGPNLFCSHMFVVFCGDSFFRIAVDMSLRICDISYVKYEIERNQIFWKRIKLELDKSCISVSLKLISNINFETALIFWLYIIKFIIGEEPSVQSIKYRLERKLKI